MSFYFDEYIQSFWEMLEKCKSKNQYIRLLEKCELMCLEYMNSLEGKEYHMFFQESPLLAMISEVQSICPEAVLELAEEKTIFSTAAYILSEYSSEDRSFLRRHYLKRDKMNLIYVDFGKNKKG
jgi:hypothetical protein